jgi:uncharacterized protein YdeI (YjbR/CyaY-like superfamily)
MSDFSNLKRDRHPMPAFVKKALLDRHLVEAYHERPAYQQNDYIGWIMKGKRESTRQGRLLQMLAELDHGDVYMKMAHKVLKRYK